MVFSVTKRMQIRMGMEATNPAKEGHLAPYRSESQPTRGDIKPGIKMQKKMRPAAVESQSNVALTNKGKTVSHVNLAKSEQNSQQAKKKKRKGNV